MLKNSGNRLVGVLVLICVASTVACGGGSGTGGAAGGNTDGDCDPGDPSASPDHDLSAMLIGTWRGDLGVSDWDKRISFSADGQYQSTYLHPTDPSDDSGTWSVSGASELPDWDTPWVLTLRSDLHDDPHWTESHQIVLIDEVGFTERKWMEGAETLVEMERVTE